MDNVFVIGDVHGNLDRLEALLKQEGLLDRCRGCDGGGIQDGHWADPDYGLDSVDCPDCKGLGVERVRKDVTVVQLGDLGDFGSGNSPTGDLLCYKYVTENQWCDVVLWGNHDRAMVDRGHAFTGFIPDYQTGHFLNILYGQGRLQIALEAHGFLITHAGLSVVFQDQKVPEHLKNDVTAFVDWINDANDDWHETGEWDDPQANGIINAISYRRGGMGSVGGILWRDIQERLYPEFRQIFGHSADHRKHQVRYVFKGRFTRREEIARKWAENHPMSYCIDVGGKPHRKSNPGHNPNCLAGIWLPSEKIVRVDL